MVEHYRVGDILVSHEGTHQEQYPIIVTRAGHGRQQPREGRAWGVFVRHCPEFPDEPITLGAALVPYTGTLSDDEIKMAAKALLLYA